MTPEDFTPKTTPLQNLRAFLQDGGFDAYRIAPAEGQTFDTIQEAMNVMTEMHKMIDSLKGNIAYLKGAR